MSFESSWTDAEAIVFEHLVKTTNSANGKNAYLGYLPDMLDVWMLNTGGSGGNEQTLWTPNIVSIHAPALIEGQFATRTAAQKFSMRVVKALPLERSGNVQAFRVAMGGAPEILPEVMAIGNESDTYLVFVVRIRCELVYSTGGRLA